MKNRLKGFIIKILTILFSLVLGLFICEIVLRIYNPLQTRVKGDNIKLLANYNRRVVLDADQAAGLDSSFNYSTNSIGFRGPDLIESTNENFKIFTVGGSTTECSLLDDKKTWPNVLATLLSENNENTWVNNAGIDGCSTFGHDVLLSEHLIHYKPDMILFLVGVNDLYQSIYQTKDAFLKSSREYRLRHLAMKSELFSFSHNLYRQYSQKHLQIGHFSMSEFELPSKNEIEERHQLHLNNQEKYKERLTALVTKCIENNIVPVLITQPVNIVNRYQLTAEIDIYNQSTIAVGHDFNLLVIDLASKMDQHPEYFYDDVHFNITGAQSVAETIYESLSALINHQE